VTPNRAPNRADHGDGQRDNADEQQQVPRVGEGEETLVMGQLRVACVQAGIPDQPGQQQRKPDQAEAQEPVQASQPAPG
jgi:hypothetical protein